MTQRIEIGFSSFVRKCLPLCALFAFSEVSAADFEGSITLKSQSSYTRIELALDSSFKAELKDEGSGFSITIPSGTLMDIGVPMGAESEFNRHLKSISDQRIGNLQVSETESGLVVRGKYKFPSGKQALANPVMEHFDFWRAEQGKFVVDFFYAKGPTLSEHQARVKLQKLEAERARIQALKQKEAQKKLSRERRIQESRDALLFCEQPFDRENTLFIKFKSDHPMLKLSQYFPDNVPDHRFQYSKPKETGEEADMVRLALKLNEENQHALTIRTVDFLEKQYPKSHYVQEMRFLKANALYRLGFAERGRTLIQDLSRSARGSLVGLQAAGFLAAQSFKAQEWLAAMESFLNLKKEMPNHEWVWLFRYGIAESLYQIRQGEQAKIEYDWLAKNAPSPELRAEAAFKVGDIFFDRNQYAEAVTYYSAAKSKFKNQISSYPSVLMNLGESYYQLGEKDRAAAEFNEYLSVASNQPVAWRAGIRIAEIKALGSKLDENAKKAFVDAINRYPMSPATVLARLRMLPCGDHGGFDLNSAERFLESKEVADFTSDGVIYESQMKDLVAVTEVRTFISFKDYQKAIDRAIARLRLNPSMDARKMIESAMIGAIKFQIERKFKENDPFGGIALYEKYGDYLPLAGHDPLTDDLKMKVAEIAAEKNLSTLALKVIEPFKKMNELSHRDLIEAIEKRLTMDGADEQESRTMIEVKTIWNSAKFDVNKDTDANELISKLAGVRDFAKFSFEKALLSGLFYEQAKEQFKALEFARKAVEKLQGKSVPVRAQVFAWAGAVGEAAQDFEFAGNCFRNARKLAQEKAFNREEVLTFRHLGVTPSLASLYKSEGFSLEKRQKWKEAVALYTEAIENKIGGNHLLYAHARALLKDGGKNSTQVASRSLEKIQQSQDDDVWKRLAQDVLKEIAKEGKVDEKRKP